MAADEDNDPKNQPPSVSSRFCQRHQCSEPDANAWRMMELERTVRKRSPFAVSLTELGSSSWTTTANNQTSDGEQTEQQTTWLGDRCAGGAVDRNRGKAVPDRAVKRCAVDA